MSEQKNSDVFLRPRFKLDFKESQQELIEKFKKIWRMEAVNIAVKLLMDIL